MSFDKIEYQLTLFPRQSYTASGDKQGNGSLQRES